MPFNNQSSETEWTLLILSSATFRSSQEESYKGEGGVVQDIKIASLLVSTLSAIQHALKTSLYSWKHLHEELVSSLPPHDYYETLLSNDNLPASIECFRVLDYLRAALPRMDHAIEEWNEWRQYHIKQDGMQCRRKAVEVLLLDIEFQVQAISIQLQDFKELEKHTETIISAVGFRGKLLLRSGLIMKQIYNITSAKETRDSRLLGENVKVLTYVTIVFLPLSFCTVSFKANCIEYFLLIRAVSVEYK